MHFNRPSLKNLLYNRALNTLALEKKVFRLIEFLFILDKNAFSICKLQQNLLLKSLGYSLNYPRNLLIHGSIEAFVHNRWLEIIHKTYHR